METPQATLLLNFVQAGFPAPGEDLEGSPLDTNQLLVKNPAATFFMRVSGGSMQDIGIYHGDIVVVDKSLEARDGDIVVAILNDAYTLKTLEHINGTPRLIAQSTTHQSINIEAGDELRIWGVVTFVVRSVRHTL
jgi:DNA polymerase V